MSKSLSDTIAEYLNYRAIAYRPNTHRASKATLDAFLAHAGNVQVKHLTPRHAERFQTFMLTKGYKPNTVNARMSQLSKFSSWAVQNRYSPLPFVGAVRNVPVPYRPRMRIPVTDFARVIEAAERPDWRITVALGLFTFSRGSEISGLRVGDVDLDQGTVAFTVVKTSDWDEKPICWELDQELRRWLVAYADDIGRPLVASDYLVPSHRAYRGWDLRPTHGNFRPDQRCPRPFVHVQRTLALAGFEVKKGEGVHTLRRSGARALFDGLVDGRLGDPAARDDALRQVMTALNHKSIITTQHYIGIEADRQRRNATIKGVRLLPELPSNITQLKEAR